MDGGGFGDRFRPTSFPPSAPPPLPLKQSAIMLPRSLIILAAALLPYSLAATISCKGAPAPAFPFKVADGWSATPILGNLSRPRKGITGHKIDDNGCVKESKVVVDDPNLNHGIDVHPDGKTIVASTPDIAFQFDYNPDKLEAGSRRQLVTGMQGPGHNTRTLLIPRKNKDYLVVSVGSGSNIDESAFQTSSGRAQIRSFSTGSLGGDGSAFTDDNAGKIMAFGMRNAVGIAEDREGNIHAVDNSVDDAYRVSIVTNSVLDIHDDNPAEKAYFCAFSLSLSLVDS
ncbi:hypothetical protein NMY22_g19943 [Coprinellus aureogranulatus]|nr:hypothetical protein NMY22_g19943 [Coprinellus aureogranulatus]